MGLPIPIHGNVFQVEISCVTQLIYLYQKGLFIDTMNTSCKGEKEGKEYMYEGRSILVNMYIYIKLVLIIASKNHLSVFSFMK